MWRTTTNKCRLHGNGILRNCTLFLFRVRIYPWIHPRIYLWTIHRIHWSRQWNDTNGISKHRLSPYNAYYLNYNSFTQFPVPVPYKYDLKLFKVLQFIPVQPQICINIHPDAVPPIHAESYHVATDKGPLQVPVYF